MVTIDPFRLAYLDLAAGIIKVHFWAHTKKAQQAKLCVQSQPINEQTFIIFIFYFFYRMWAWALILNTGQQIFQSPLLSNRTRSD